MLFLDILFFIIGNTIKIRMDYSEFQLRYEQDGKNALYKYIKLSEDELLEIVNKKQWDNTYQIWYALKKKGTKKAIKPIYQIVSNLKNDYLIRYHACNALFHIAAIRDDEFKGMVQYGRNSARKRINQVQAIKKLEEVLLNRYLI
jgi:hypothetical protein